MAIVIEEFDEGRRRLRIADSGLVFRAEQGARLLADRLQPLVVGGLLVVFVERFDGRAEHVRMGDEIILDEYAQLRFLRRREFIGRGETAEGEQQRQARAKRVSEFHSRSPERSAPGADQIPRRKPWPAPRGGFMARRQDIGKTSSFNNVNLMTARESGARAGGRVLEPGTPPFDGRFARVGRRARRFG